MKQIHCILDACTIINLLNIDRGQFLQKKLEKLSVAIPEKVFSELTGKGKLKLEKSDYKNAESKELALKERDAEISSFRKFIISNHRIKVDIDDEMFFERIKLLVGHDKENGEFYSMALGFYLSRFNEIKVFFHTDDFPAKEKFQHHFLFHQLGHVEDSSDLLMLLYRLSDNKDFKQDTLDNFLSSLFSEYATEAKAFSNKINIFIKQLPTKYLKDTFVKGRLHTLRASLEKMEFHGINKIRDEFNRSPYYDDVKRIFNDYTRVFDLESKQAYGLLEKISQYKSLLKQKKIYRICEN